MTFNKYKDSVKESFNSRTGNYNLLRLVSETTSLLEKMKYFRNETNLIISDIGDVIFRLFAIMDEYKIELNELPFDLDGYKDKVPQLASIFSITEEALQTNYMFEVGIMNTIVADHIRYGIEKIGPDDLVRMKNSIYSYILQLLVLVSKLQLSIEPILSMNISRVRARKKDLNFRS